MTAPQELALRIGVAELRRRPGNRTSIRREVPVGGLAISTAEVPDGSFATVELTLEALSDGVTVTGWVEVPWQGECRRCLELTSGTIRAPIEEIFKDHPDEGETLPTDGDAIDLGPVVHDAVILALPLAPLCREGCIGPDPGAFPVHLAAGDTVGAVAGEGADDGDQPPIDPRWAALDQLRFDSDGDE